eukprot:m.48320 g.48320  ORF g.48320 m.48320 type:complete len:596 (-) comp6979_c0_seq1:112-1899(-)
MGGGDNVVLSKAVENAPDKTNIADIKRKLSNASTSSSYVGKDSATLRRSKSPSKSPTRRTSDVTSTQTHSPTIQGTEGHAAVTVSTEPTDADTVAVDASKMDTDAGGKASSRGQKRRASTDEAPRPAKVKKQTTPQEAGATAEDDNTEAMEVDRDNAHDKDSDGDDDGDEDEDEESESESVGAEESKQDNESEEEEDDSPIELELDLSDVPEEPSMPDLPLMWGKVERFTADTVEVGKPTLGLQKHMLYPAKIVKVESEKGRARIHYMGWKSRYDEWFPYDGLVVDNDAGRALMDALVVARDYPKAKAVYDKAYAKAEAKAQKKYESAIAAREAAKKKRELAKIRAAKAAEEAAERRAKRNAERAAQRAERNAQRQAEREQRKKDIAEGRIPRPSKGKVPAQPLVEVEEEEEEKLPSHVQTPEAHYNKRRPEVLIRINDELKVKIVEEWDYITQKSMLVKLPRDPSVNSVLSDYTVQAKQKGWCSSEVADELVVRLKEYFRKDLPRKLLYPQEKKQFKAMTHGSDVDVCDIYGPEHLLRLFTALPAALAQTALGRRQMEANVKCLQDVLKFLALNAAQLFPAEAFADAKSAQTKV